MELKFETHHFLILTMIPDLSKLTIKNNNYYYLFQLPSIILNFYLFLFKVILIYDSIFIL